MSVASPGDESTREGEVEGGNGMGGTAFGSEGGDGGGDSSPPPDELPMGAEKSWEAAVATAHAAIDGTLEWG